MEKIDLNEYLASNEYPGRGIAVAMAPDGRQMFIGYFIMGRSENSRNRVFTETEDGIRTEAFDPSRSGAASAPWPPTPTSWKTPASSSITPC